MCVLNSWLLQMMSCLSVNSFKQVMFQIREFMLQWVSSLLSSCHIHLDFVCIIKLNPDFFAKMHTIFIISKFEVVLPICSYCLTCRNSVHLLIIFTLAGKELLKQFLIGKYLLYNLFATLPRVNGWVAQCTGTSIIPKY